MNPACIAELLKPFLGSEAYDQGPSTNDALYNQISTYIDLLLRWNARINLTAIRTEEEIVTRHFGESLFAARHLFPRMCSVNPVSSVLKDLVLDPSAQPRAADLGSGPGFPGIPIKLWAPQIHMTLIESNHKKSAFLREIVRSLTLTNIDIKIDRAESVSGIYDLVTLRAVERFTSVLPIAARLVKPRGRLALLISSHQLAQANSLLPTFSWDLPLPIPESASRVLQIARAL
jgi:16S rRNA (guanine527-N7)-methyltransferase